MSYLLKALEKAQQERGAGDKSSGPNHIPGQAPSALPLPIILGVVLFLFVAAGAGVLINLKMVAESEDAVEVETSEPSQNNGNDVEKAVPKPPENTSIQAYTSHLQSSNKPPRRNPAVHTVSNPTRPVSNDVTEDSNKLYSLMELDKETLSALPSIRFQSHIYSNTPSARTVTLNDRTLREGMMVSESTRLKSITPTGIVIELGELQIELGFNSHEPPLQW